MDLLISDLRFARRQIRRHPRFALIAAVSLVIGVGANAAVFNPARIAIFGPVPEAAEPELFVEVVILIVVLTASLILGRRAAAIEPMRAPKSE
jgi:hypothetical protein